MEKNISKKNENHNKKKKNLTAKAGTSIKIVTRKNKKRIRKKATESRT